jgi:hypothetical protein
MLMLHVPTSFSFSLGIIRVREGGFGDVARRQSFYQRCCTTANILPLSDVVYVSLGNQIGDSKGRLWPAWVKLPFPFTRDRDISNP